MTTHEFREISAALEKCRQEIERSFDRMVTNFQIDYGDDMTGATTNER